LYGKGKEQSEDLHAKKGQVMGSRNDDAEWACKRVYPINVAWWKYRRTDGIFLKLEVCKLIWAGKKKSLA
jgi:hypothetical protein